MRGRCAVRNHGHKARVVSSDGDRSQLREGGTPRVLAASRNMAVGSMRLTGRRDLAQAGRRYAGRPARAPSLVGSERAGSGERGATRAAGDRYAGGLALGLRLCLDLVVP